MYWQVYLHKTVIGAEKMLVRIIERVQELLSAGEKVTSASVMLDYFLLNTEQGVIEKHLDEFCQLDDYDVLSAIKNWVYHPDKILSTLCKMLVERKLLKVKLQAAPFDPDWIEEQRKSICKTLQISEAESRYFLFSGEAVSTTYDPYEEKINILFKDGTVRDISRVDNALIQQSLSTPVKKYYICYYSCQV